MKRIIHWFRRDLRISDNKSLYAAWRDSDEVIPVYILSSWKRSHPWTGANRQEFLCGCLTSLAKNLEEIGGRLILRSGSPVKELIRLAEETQADAIYFNEDYAPYDRDVEEQIQKAARAKGIRVQRFKDTMILAPTEVISQSGQPFRVFTAYARGWHGQKKPVPLPKVSRITTPSGLDSLVMPALAHWGLRSEAKILAGGEKAADDRLKAFLKLRIYDYANRRNDLSWDGNSRLSQDLRFGTISPREIYASCKKAADECNAAQRHGFKVFSTDLGCGAS